LESELCRQCDDAGAALIPPRTITPGSIPAALLDSPEPVAIPAEQELAWLEALRRVDGTVLEALFPGEGDDGARRGAGFAGVLDRLAADVGAADRAFADVAEWLDANGYTGEAERWRALAAIESHYLAALDEAGLVDPLRRARRLASQPAVRTDLEVLLVGVVELNTLQRRVLEAIDDSVTAIIHAPESEAPGFDDLGCVIPGAWAARPIDMPDERIHIADRPADQAQCALDIIREFSDPRNPRPRNPRNPRNPRPRNPRSGDEIVLGLGDPSLQPTLVRCGAWAGAGLHVHPAAGVPLAQTAPVLFLRRLADWVEERRFSRMIELLRHPDVEAWVARGFESEDAARRGVEAWLGLLEEYFVEHLQERIDGEWLGTPDDQAALRRIHRAMTELASPFDAPPRPIGAWMPVTLASLADVFGDLGAESHARPRSDAACMAIRSIAEELAAAPERLQPAMTAVEAIRHVLSAAERRTIPAEVRDGQIDLLGWLELHLDVAPALILTGFNDGSIPSHVLGDPFLPDSLRHALGMADNASRAGRDAYLLRAALESREAHLIAGRRGGDDSPLLPSRFLFACDDETMLRRVRRFTNPGLHAGRTLPRGVPAPAASSAFEIPPLPDDLELPESMRITDFRLYLQCPYRYALQRLAGLRAFEPEAREMDPLRFGHLAHQVLEAFGRDEEARELHDPDAIERFLIAALDRLAARQFGRERLPAIHVQLARLRQRLHDFARWQAARRAEGWRIRHSELSFRNEYALDIPDDGPDMPLRGKIDRIDFHPETGRWQVIDYKTGEKASTPHEAHHGGKKIPPDDALEWRDLQLPLYRFLVDRAASARRADLPLADGGRIELGYIVLPKQSGGVTLHCAGWTETHLEHALDAARDVVRNIRARRFEINDEYVSSYDDFARICQTTVFGAGASAEDGDDDE